MTSCGRAVEALQRREAMLKRQRLAALPGAFPARFPGVCGECGEPFAVGAVARYDRYTSKIKAECCL